MLESVLIYYYVATAVTGDTNFAMPFTRLTVGGFTQPGVARSLIELPSNAEKGLSHRFMWLFPAPLFGTFSSLGEVDKEFQRTIGKDIEIKFMFTE